MAWRRGTDSRLSGVAESRFRQGRLLWDLRRWLNLLHLHFLIYEMGLMAVPASQGAHANEIRALYENQRLSVSP